MRELSPLFAARLHATQGIHAARDRGEPHRLLEAIAPPPEWIDGRELCSQVDPEIFHPEKGESVAEAKAVCVRCELRETCLEWAIETNRRFGVWGAASERERRRIRDQRRGAA